MKKISFCPICATPFVRRKVDKMFRLVCPSCSFIFYRNSKPCVGALILSGSSKEILLTRRAFPPKAGTWDIPGGFLENGEDPVEGLKREILEELGVPCRVGSLFKIGIDVYRDGEFTLNLFYFVKLLGKVKKVSDDVSEFAFFPLNKLPKNIGFNFAKKVLKELAGRVLPAHAK